MKHLCPIYLWVLGPLSDLEERRRKNENIIRCYLQDKFVFVTFKLWQFNGNVYLNIMLMLAEMPT